MPMVAFLPWTAITKPVRFGQFHVVPAGVVLGGSELPEEHGPAIRTILEAYNRPRRVDQDRVPLLRRDDLAYTADLGDDEVNEYFGFRRRLTFSVLAGRQFFHLRYANADHTRLVIQGFTPERAGGALLQLRRRDGATNVRIPPGHLSIPRPHHLAGACELPKDLDLGLLASLERAIEEGPPWWPRIDEAIRLFVEANTDSPDVSEHSELIDVVSAFSLVADEWKAAPTVTDFAETLPSPGGLPDSARLPGAPKARNERLAAALQKGKDVRAVWLDDMYQVRSHFGHGRVTSSEYPAIWTEREHLLLASVAFPLYLKAYLHAEGLYSMTEEDAVVNTALDALMLLEPFDGRTPEDDEEEPGAAWRETISAVGLHLRLHVLIAALDADDPEGMGYGPDLPEAPPPS